MAASSTCRCAARGSPAQHASSTNPQRGAAHGLKATAHSSRRWPCRRRCRMASSEMTTTTTSTCRCRMARALRDRCRLRRGRRSWCQRPASKARRVSWPSHLVASVLWLPLCMPLSAKLGSERHTSHALVWLLEPFESVTLADVPGTEAYCEAWNDMETDLIARNYPAAQLLSVADEVDVSGGARAVQQRAAAWLL